MRTKNNNLVSRHYLITKDQDKFITNVSNKLGIRKSEVVRYILNEYFEIYSEYLPNKK